jgi:SAM-dependent methyltransferase
MDTVSALTHNFPTVSTPEAMSRFSNSRNNERDTLLSYVDLQPGMHVLDIQAAGGYLSDEVFRRLNGDVINVCVEPNSELRARLNPAFRSVDNPVEHFASLADESVDIALGLIGLHHSKSHRATLSEAYRVLKPAGELAVCDVVEGSRLAAWLNEFVMTHCPSGHFGNFPASGSMNQICTNLGFQDVVEEERNVPWVFKSRQDVLVFFQGLFGLTVDLETIDAALDDYFTLQTSETECTVDWHLAYCHARKPR